MTLRRLRLATFLGFLLFVAASVTVTFWALRAQQADAMVINLAGRQRMLTQKMTLQVLGLQIGAIPAYGEALHNTAHAYFERTLEALIAGGEAPYTDDTIVTLPPTRDADTLAQLETVRATWDEMDLAIHTVLEEDPPSAAFDEAVATVKRLSPVILAQTDQAVQMYEAEAARKVARVQTIQIGFLAAAAALLVVAFFFTERWVLGPIVRLRTAARRIGEGDLTTLVPIAGPREISRLARSFDDMRRSLAASRTELEAWAEQLGERVRKRTGQLSALHEVTALIGASPDLEQMLDAAVGKASEAMQVEAAAVMLLDPESEELRLTAHRGLSERFVREISRIKLGAELSGRAAASGEPIVLSNAADDPRLTRSVVREEGFRAFASVPLLSRGQVLGVLNVGSRQERTFPADEVTLLGAIGQLLGAAIENVRLYEQVKERHIEEQATLLRLSQALLGESDMQAMMDLTVRVAAQALQVELAAIALVDEDGQSYSGRAGVGWPPEVLQQTRRLPLAALPGLEYAIRTQAPVVIPDEAQETRFGAPPWVTQMEITSSLIAPMLAAGEAIGGLVINSRAARDWSDDEVRLLSLIANDTAQALERARLFEAERAAREQAETLREVASALNASLDREQVLRLILEQLARVVDYDSASVMLVSDQALDIVAQRGFRSESQQFTPLQVDALQHVQEVLAERCPAIIPDTAADPRWQHLPDSEYIRCWLGVPLVAQRQVIGLLNLDKEQPGFYTERYAELAVAFANQAATAIENARLFETERRRVEELAGLHEIAQAFSTLTETRETYGALAERLARLIGARVCIVTLYDPHSGEMRAQTPGYGVSDENVAAVRYPARAAAREVWDFRKGPFRVNARAEFPTFGKHILEELGLESVLAVPMRVEDRILGAVFAANKPGGFSEDDARLLDVFASQAGAVIENTRLFEETHRRLQEVTLLSRVIALTAAAEDLPTALQEVCAELARFFQVPQAAYALLNPQRTAAEVIAEYREPERPSALGIVIPVADNPSMAYILEHKAPLAVADAQTDPLLEPIREIMRQREIASLLLAPILIEEEVAGTLGVDALQRREFSAADVTLMEHVASQVGQTLERLRLFTATREHAELMGRLSTLGETLNRPATLDDVITAIGQGALALSGADRAAVYLRQPDDTATCPWSHGLSPTYLEQVTTRMRELPGGEMLERPEPILLSDIQTFPEETLVRRLVEAEGFRAPGLWPLVYEERVVAAVGCYCDAPHTWSEAEQDVMLAFARQAAVALENARLFEEAERRLRHVQALRAIDTAIAGSLDLRVNLNVLLDKATTQLGVDAADVLLLNPHTQTLECATRRGFRTTALQQTRLRLGEGQAGRAALEQRTISISDFGFRVSDLGFPQAAIPELQSEDFVVYYATPLIAKGKVQGVLEIFHRTPLAPDPEWLDLLQTLATQAALAVDNASLFNDLQRSNVELTLAYDATIKGWARALELRDEETEGHTQRVAELTVRLARAMGMSDEELVHVRRGALLHDIGKMGIPDSILRKPSQLSEAEWEIMRRHPTHAFEMLSPIVYLRPALDIPYCHHEKWDGTGYPRGLHGKQIPLAARIFAVVDVWDALRSDRPYREAWPEEKVYAYLREQVGKHFDPPVAEAFLRLAPGNS